MNTDRLDGARFLAELERLVVSPQIQRKDGNYASRRCLGCERCMFCSDCEECFRCTYCRSCHGCTSCTHCDRCSACHECAYCVDTQRSSESAYLTRCRDCVGCTYCFGCVGLSRCEFHILNVPYSKEQFFAVTERLRAELAEIESSPIGGSPDRLQRS